MSHDPQYIGRFWLDPKGVTIGVAYEASREALNLKKNHRLSTDSRRLAGGLAII